MSDKRKFTDTIDDLIRVVDTKNDVKIEKIESEKDAKEVKNNPKDDKIKEEKVEIEDIQTLKNKIESLTKQKLDTEIWGRNQKNAFKIVKDRIQELSKKYLDNSTIFEDEYNEIQKVFDQSLTSENDSNENKQESNPFESVMDNIQNTFSEYKKWSDDKELDNKFDSFFRHLELISPKKLKDIQEYLLGEKDNKEALKFILSNGEKYYNKFYKQAKEKGDGLAYIEEILTKNENLQKELTELKSQLDQVAGKVYSKSLTATNSFNGGESSYNGLKRKF